MRSFDWMRKIDRRAYVTALMDHFDRGLITTDNACRDMRDIVLSSTKIRFALSDERFLTRRILAILHNVQVGALRRSQAQDFFEKLLTAAIRDDVGFFTSSHLMADA